MYTLHLISHTHWDREWYQTFQQFRLRLVHLVDNLLDILDHDPQYQHFMLDGQTIVLDDYLQIRPEREADLRRYIQEGRILVGPWYLLPDEFLVSPEATVRNLLEGDRIAARFGPKMMVGYIPDPFGHIGQMPQILRGFGIENASLWRGVGDELNEFWWQSPDGSRVLMGYLRQSYGNAAGILSTDLDNFVAEVRSIRDALAPYTRGNDLLLMHGTDHQEPDPRTSAAVAYAANKLDGDQLVHSTLPDYFECVRSTIDLDRLPVVRGELRSSKFAPLLPGVLSARMWIKQRNQACETLLERWAEPFSAWAQTYGDINGVNGAIRQPEPVLRQAWRQLMQCHPHDSICGCSIDQVHEEMRPRFDQAEQVGEEITRQSLEMLVRAINTRHPMSETANDAAIIVFNPTASQRNDAVTVAGIEIPSGVAEFELVDDAGNSVPFQSLSAESGNVMNMIMDRRDLAGSFRMIKDGAIMGMRIQDVQMSRSGSEVSIEMRYSSTGKPNLAVWENSQKEIGAYLKDPEITQYHVVFRPVASSTVCFSAKDVPGLGYRTYWVRGKASDQNAPGQVNPLARVVAPVAARLASTPAGQKLLQRIGGETSSKPPYRIENEFFIVEALPDGTLTIQDRQSGMVFKGNNRFVDGGDRGDEYNYSAPEVDRLSSVKLKSVQVERGEVQQSLDLELEIEAPEELEEDRRSRSQKTVILPVSSQVTLTSGVPRVDIHTEIENRARDHRLRVHFQAPFIVSEADYDGHFEIVRRPLGVPAFDDSWAEQPRPEAPQRAFTCVESAQVGLMAANRGLPEVEVVPHDGGTEIALTLLRCVGWLSRDDFPERKGHAGPGMATPGAQMPGTWAFDYAVIPFKPEQKIEACQQAYAFGAPMRAMSTDVHPGNLPHQGAFLAVEPQSFAISAVKATEDGRGWLARGYNLSNQTVQVRLTTIQPFDSAERVSLAETPIEGGKLAGNQTITTEVQGREIATIAFRTKQE